MSGTYKNIKTYAFAEHTEAFSILLEVFNSYAIQFFLIGAQARDMHFFRKGIKPARATRDIDFAVMVESMSRYNELLKGLQVRGFETTKIPYRLNWARSRTLIDLLPFGQIQEEYTVNFVEREIELSVLGYCELNEELQEFYVSEDDSLSIPVPPLHGIFMLKLLSWDDKKPDREKDLKDMSQILGNYWEFIEEEAYSKHLDLFDDNFEIKKTAARILGRHLRGTLRKSDVLKKNVIRILEEQSVAVDPPGLMLQKFSNYEDKTIDSIKILLDEILIGINE